MTKNFESIIFGSPSTVKTQKSLFKNWISDIDPYTMDEFKLRATINEWREAGLKPGTIRQLISLLKKYVKFEAGNELDSRMVVRQLNHMKQEDPKIKAWTPEETKKALVYTKANDPELYDLMLLTLHTGLRKSELFALKWRDVDILNGKIFVRKSKSGKPRVIPMSEKVAEFFEKVYPIGQDDELCFKYIYVNERLNRICRATKINRIAWHGLRHTFATILLDSGENLKSVSTLLGHQKLSTTLDIYWGVTDKKVDLECLP